MAALGQDSANRFNSVGTLAIGAGVSPAFSARDERPEFVADLVRLRFGFGLDRPDLGAC